VLYTHRVYLPVPSSAFQERKLKPALQEQSEFARTKTQLLEVESEALKLERCLDISAIVFSLDASWAIYAMLLLCFRLKFHCVGFGCFVGWPAAARTGGRQGCKSTRAEGKGRAAA